MQRRSFVGGACALSLVGVPAGLAAAPARGGPLVESYVTSIADSFGAGPTDVVPGADLLLRRLPERRFDPDTVGVLRPDGRLLGFLPKSHGQILARLLDAGLPLTATATATRDRPRTAIRLEISLATN